MTAKISYILSPEDLGSCDHLRPFRDKAFSPISLGYITREGKEGSEILMVSVVYSHIPLIKKLGLPGGHILRKGNHIETPLETAGRKIMEETGIETRSSYLDTNFGSHINEQLTSGDLKINMIRHNEEIDCLITPDGTIWAVEPESKKALKASIMYLEPTDPSKEPSRPASDKRDVHYRSMEEVSKEFELLTPLSKQFLSLAGSFEKKESITQPGDMLIRYFNPESEFKVSYMEKK